MNKDKFIQKVAANSMSLLQKRELADRLTDDYYRKNPSAEISDHKKGLAEIGIPTALGAALSRSTQKGIPLGLAGGILLNQIASAGRRQKILKEQGVDTDLLNVKMEPITQQARKKYFK